MKDDTYTLHLTGDQYRLLQNLVAWAERDIREEIEDSIWEWIVGEDGQDAGIATLEALDAMLNPRPAPGTPETA